MSLKIITTSDGSHSLLNETLKESYHSVHGALQESLHVFIKKGLEFVSQDRDVPLRILEVGFGTGLNALLTLQHAVKHQQNIHFTTIELYPLPEDIWSALNYPTTLDLADEYREIHHASWGKDQLISNYFTLLKICDSIQDARLPINFFDLIYYDAFAPSKQPELWELPVLEKIFGLMKRGGTLATYCAKGQLKRDLKSLGMTVETLPGPPGKKEMVRAVKM
ncbi:tRNA (5-methylaminomethyl-2-thiouridine)(34)-methyltransferase MnmD [Chryseolinea sp. H1M3-3]|uniref:tRNA (5-methylaminomethyl-2-thiouridine)(34)-methyltransferase MnmD n=1 Tax=Chryseolinea sp. H1M3-3 TaxID=3034144 RepID=UPI0023EC719B|nr:tRNA (5-methylaminomethyl-2-thiouridine)(34)-methyltransferase MnmD [Chryseolinea sp. H1M3-3]